MNVGTYIFKPWLSCGGYQNTKKPLSCTYNAHFSLPYNFRFPICHCTRHNPKYRGQQTGAGNPSDEESESSDENLDRDSNSMCLDSDSAGVSDATFSASGQSDSDEPDLDANDGSDLEARIAAFVNRRVHGKEIVTPRHENPFKSNTNMETFEEALQSVRLEGVVPDGYGVLPEEWDDGGYPSYEILKVGRRGAKQLRVALPHEVWRS